MNCLCGHTKNQHDPEDRVCDAHAAEGLGRCPCPGFVPDDEAQLRVAWNRADLYEALPVSPRLDYILASLRRAAEHGYPWSVLPGEATALVAEVERLRAGLTDIGQIVRDGMAVARAQGYDAARAEVEQLRQDAADAEEGAATFDQIEAVLDGAEVVPTRDGAARVAALRAERDRLCDLVRHQRGPLHDAGLLTDAEYAALAADAGAVARLEGYDAARAEVERLRATVSFLRACVPPRRPSDYGHEIWAEEVQAAEARGRDEERARIVADLRSAAPSADDRVWYRSPSLTLEACAERYERGDHAPKRP